MQGKRMQENEKKKDKATKGKKKWKKIIIIS